MVSTRAACTRQDFLTVGPYAGLTSVLKVSHHHRHQPGNCPIQADKDYLSLSDFPECIRNLSQDEDPGGTEVVARRGTRWRCRSARPEFHLRFPTGMAENQVLCNFFCRNILLGALKATMRGCPRQNGRSVMWWIELSEEGVQGLRSLSGRFENSLKPHGLTMEGPRRRLCEPLKAKRRCWPTKIQTRSG